MATGDTPSNVITIRFIRSFPHRNVKYVVYKDVDLSQSAQEFMDGIISGTD